ncbi:MAG: NAD(P)-dependent oxidoreductase [Candidatus Micrarchaeota archaeon]|nr:NAD(P)-dependent oxidoreductase [Candidatus Micrarchaeota archaeon]
MQQQNMHADTVFVTGATGRLGRAVVPALVGSGSAVRALMVEKEDVKLLPPGTVPFVGSLGDTEVLDEACRGADVVLHFAGLTHVANSTAEAVMESNVEGTKNLLKACEKGKVKHMIFTSTVDVYGRKRSGALNEDAKLLPTDKYGHSKMLAEQEISGSGVPYTIVRPANIYGPGFERSFFKIFRAVKEGKMVIIGSGENHVALVHVDDVVKALMLIKENPQASIGKTYNLTDGMIYTQEGLIDLVAELMKVPKPKRHMQEILVRALAKARNLDSDELRFMTSDRVIDTSRIRNELGFIPDVDIKTGGMAMINEFLNKAKEK